MDEVKRVPFSRDIPHFPGEDPLPGMPNTPEESVFLSTPELAHTANIVVEYASKEKLKEKNYIIDRTIVEIMEHPEHLSAVFDSLEILRVTGGYTEVQEFEQELERTIRDKVSRELPSRPDVTIELLTLMSHSAIYRPLVEKILAAAFEQCKDTRSLMQMLYDTTALGFLSNDTSIIKETLKIIGLQTNALPVDSHAAALFHLAGFDRDDGVLRLALDIHSIFHLVSAVSFPDIYKTAAQQRKKMMAGNEYSRSMRIFFQGYDPKRLAALEGMYGGDVDELGVREMKESEHIDSSKFPYNIMLLGGGPLREIHNKILAREMTRRTGELTANLHLPSGNIVSKGGHKSIAEIIRNDLNRKGESFPSFERLEYWETLSYLLPDELQSAELLRIVGDVNEVLKEEMLYDSKYLLSPRGDHVEITDAALKELGFRSVMYEMDQRNKRDTIVTVSVGNFTYRMLLDEFFVPREIASHSALDLPLEGNFIQHILLSHLHEIRCFNRGVGIGEGGTSSSRRRGGEQRDGAVVSRRAFRRLLHEGDNPTEVQILRARTEYHIDIIRMNREVAARGERRRYTWVVEIDNGAPGQGPIRSQRPQATRQLQKILTGAADTAADTPS